MHHQELKRQKALETKTKGYRKRTVWNMICKDPLKMENTTDLLARILGKTLCHPELRESFVGKGIVISKVHYDPSNIKFQWKTVQGSQVAIELEKSFKEKLDLIKEKMEKEEFTLEEWSSSDEGLEGDHEDDLIIPEAEKHYSIMNRVTLGELPRMKIVRDVFFSGTGPYEAEYKELKKQEEKFAHLMEGEKADIWDPAIGTIKLEDKPTDSLGIDRDLIIQAVETSLLKSRASHRLKKFTDPKGMKMNDFLGYSLGNDKKKLEEGQLSLKKAKKFIASRRKEEREWANRLGYDHRD